MKFESKINSNPKVRIFVKSKNLPQIFTFYFLLFTFLFSTNAFAQDDEEEFPEYIPPPKIELSKSEKSALESEQDVKKYTKLAIDLMEVRLAKAEELLANQSFNEVLQELGGFHALMNSTLRFLNQTNTRNSKSLDNFKRYELALRSFMPRIETIRREVPDRHGIYVFSLLKLVRDNRTKAVEPLFADTVVPNADN